MSEFAVNTAVWALKVVSFVLDLVTWLPYCVIQRPDKVKAGAKRLKAVPANGDPSQPWRSVDLPDNKLTTSIHPSCEVLPDLFDRACELFKGQPCLGTREILSEESETQPNGKVFKKLVLGNYTWETYDEVRERVDNFAGGLLSLGVTPNQKLVIFAETRAEWMITAQACFKNNIPLVTLYASLSVEAIIHGILETEVTHVITTLELLPKFESVCPKTSNVRHIIVLNASRANVDKLALNLPDGVTVSTMREVENQGKNNKSKVSKPKPDDVAVIMYTSGSTGLPKGVVISHRNLMCGTSGQTERITGLGVNDIYIGYLPLAHVLELSAEISCVAFGTRIGYSSPTTLTDKSSKIKKGSLGDVSVLQPTLMAAVPVIMDRIYKNVWEKINSGSFMQRVLFKFAYEYKLRHILNGFDTPLLNKVVFSKIFSLLGGRVRLMLSGGAPLSSTTQHFMNICFCCPVGQGYGLTETCGAGTLEFEVLFSDRVGPPLLCSEIRLRDWEEGGYKSSNKPHPQGEVLLGGGNIAMGYFRNEEKTKEDFIIIDGIRYFCSGDIGQFDPDGSLRIIDRKKDLVKLQHGEYVSLAQVETVLKMCPLVEQICIVAHSTESTVVGLVVPNQTRLEAVAKSVGASGDFASLCENEKVKAEVLKQLTQHGLKGKLQRVEIPTKISLYTEPWMPDSGLVTDAFKLKRKNIEERFSSAITTMYK